jgi:hypothetical protein
MYPRMTDSFMFMVEDSKCVDTFMGPGTAELNQKIISIDRMRKGFCPHAAFGHEFIIATGSLPQNAF